ncbi:hypothetical protein AB0E81_30715 [Streptomyces sp. NPDC033538]|uniref:hypothetical protein n=1 Tax=Streptomyces sp. NPDC033538 TaxID=3155367 RepID=UPI00340E5551
MTEGDSRLRRTLNLLARLCKRYRREEKEWALDTVRELAVPPTANLDDVVRLVVRRIGRPIAVVPTDEHFANGVVENGPANTLWIRVPASCSDRHRDHVVCRGLIRLLYQEPAHHGRIEYSQAIEREMEYAAMALSSSLHSGSRSF